MKNYFRPRRTASPNFYENENHPHDFLESSHKGPAIEVLNSYPPQLRVNGTTIPWPANSTPQEAYEMHLRGKKEKQLGPGSQTHSKEHIVLANNTTHSQLHPLRKQYLENRLNEIAYQERIQTMQDSFTTTMYGTKNYTEEKNNIINELNRNSAQERTSQPNKIPSSSKKENFTPAPPDEPSDFDRRKELWEEQNRWKEFQKSRYEGQSAVQPNGPNAFERLGIPDPKNPPESISASDKAKRDFYKFPQPNGQTTEEWKKKNEEWRNTPRKDKDGNIIGSELRCNTVSGRELSKLGIDVAKDANMNTIIEGMEQSGDWADLPVDKNGNTDHATALKLAQEGYIVAATEKGEKNGHAALLTGKERDSAAWNGKVPEVYGSVNGKTAKAEGISHHWQAKDKNNIKYKIYRYKRPI